MFGDRLGRGKPTVSSKPKPFVPSQIALEAMHSEMNLPLARLVRAWEMLSKT